MPTGYTADIAKGISFKQYALNCARAFGALIMMRDDPADAPIPEKFEPSTKYHDEEIAKAKATIKQITAASVEQLNDLIEKEYKEKVDYNDKKISEINELRAKYEAMLAQAKAYQPPTPEHEGYAKFLVTQIEESISWDCSTDYYKTPEKESPIEYSKRKVAEARKTIAYHEAEREKEIERTNSRNEWVKALRESLELPHVTNH